MIFDEHEIDGSKESTNSESINWRLKNDPMFSQEAIRHRLATMVEAGFSLSKLAIDIGIKRTDLSAWAISQIESEEIFHKIADEFFQADNEYIEDEPKWVATPTSQRIWSALAQAQAEPGISVIYGAAGVGKTTTLKRYKSEYTDRVVMVTANTYIQKPIAILKEIAAQLGVYGAAYKNEIYDNVYDQLLRMTQDENALLIVDEAQHLDAEALDGIRALSDSGCIGIVYAGNDKIYTQMHGKGRRQSAFAQLTSRVGNWCQITLPTDDDVNSILEAWRIKGRKEREYARTIARRPGAFRDLIRLLRTARKLARGMGLQSDGVDLKIMEAAASFIGMEV